MSGSTRTGVAAFLQLGCTMLALCVYCTTLAPTISWGNFPSDALAAQSSAPDTIVSEDSAELAGAAATLGIAHPPGYPLYVLLAHAFTRLPLGDEAAYRTNLFSAVSAAAAVALLWLALRAVAGSTLAASVAALLFAFSYTFWFHAIVTEVHALHAALLALALVLAIQAARTADRRWLYAFALAAGLGVVHHVTTVLYLPGFLVLVWRPLREVVGSPGGAIKLAASGAAGLAPYLFVPLRSAQDPIYNWGAATTPARLWALLSGSEYQTLLDLDSARILTGVATLPARLVVEFGAGACLLGAAGWVGWVWRRRGAALGPGTGEPILPALLLMGAAQLAFTSVYLINDPMPLQIPMNLVFAFGIALAVAGLEARLRGAGWLGRLAFGAVLAALVAHLVLQEVPRVRVELASIESRLPQRLRGVVLPHSAVSMRRHYMAARYSRGVLDALPPDTVFVVVGDGRFFSLIYEQWVNGRRPDVFTVSAPLLAHPWYRERIAKELSIPGLASLSVGSGVEAIVAVAESARRPVYFNARYAIEGLEERELAVRVPLPPVGPADRVIGDVDTLYRVEPERPQPAPGSSG